MIMGDMAPRKELTDIIWLNGQSSQGACCWGFDSGVSSGFPLLFVASALWRISLAVKEQLLSLVLFVQIVNQRDLNLFWSSYK